MLWHSPISFPGEIIVERHRIPNPQDYALFTVVNGQAKQLEDHQRPQEIKLQWTLENTIQQAAGQQQQQPGSRFIAYKRKGPPTRWQLPSIPPGCFDTYMKSTTDKQALYHSFFRVCFTLYIWSPNCHLNSAHFIPFVAHRPRVSSLHMAKVDEIRTRVGLQEFAVTDVILITISGNWIPVKLTSI